METSRNLKSDLKNEIKQETKSELPKTPPRCLSDSPPRFQIATIIGFWSEIFFSDDHLFLV